MCSFKEIIVIALLVACVSGLQADSRLKVTPTSQGELGVLKQVKTIPTRSGDSLYAYTCTVGQNKTGSLGCTGGDSVAWSVEQDVELTVWCDRSHDGRAISYAEVEFVVSTQNVACRVASGGIGQDHIELAINVWGTTQLDYATNFYIY